MLSSRISLPNAVRRMQLNQFASPLFRHGLKARYSTANHLPSWRKISPRTVLKLSGESFAGTILALSSVILYINPDLRSSVAATISSLESTYLSPAYYSTLNTTRTNRYAPFTYLPRNYVHHIPPSESKAAASSATPADENDGLRKKVFQIVLGDKEYRIDLSDLENLVSMIGKFVGTIIKRDGGSDTGVGQNGEKEGRLPFGKCSNSITYNFLNLSYILYANHCVKARPEFSARVYAWLIDSAIVGLIATPFWGIGLYGTVSCLTWVTKDLIFQPLLGIQSPGYHIMKLEKIKTHIANELRPSSSDRLELLKSHKEIQVDSKRSEVTKETGLSPQILSKESVGFMGHNMLRFLTYCSNLGPISSMATMFWLGYAFLNGVEETVDAWDRFCGVSVVNENDVKEFLKSGVVPVRVRKREDEIDGASGKKEWKSEDNEFEAQIKVGESKIKVDVDVDHVDSNGKESVWVRVVKDGHEDKAMQFRLPSFVKVFRDGLESDADKDEKKSK
ncbi:hypothetical protein BKA69DRAFT_868 [Paraphysoderma sedebokerense]|nr:hypothetical protein BKA69DRAFT_868 [Paraphysoderma sedebokerense]